MPQITDPADLKELNAVPTEDKSSSEIKQRATLNYPNLLQTVQQLSKYDPKEDVLMSNHGVSNLVRDLSEMRVDTPFFKVKDLQPLKGLAPLLAKYDPKYVNYRQLNDAFNSAFAPLQAGATQTDTEMLNVAKGTVPREGDTAEIRARKIKAQRAITNAVAKMQGLPIPFPNDPVWQTTQTGAVTSDVKNIDAKPNPAGAKVRYLGTERK